MSMPTLEKNIFNAARPCGSADARRAGSVGERFSNGYNPKDQLGTWLELDKARDGALGGKNYPKK
jgi:hypothetical protein